MVLSDTYIAGLWTRFLAVEVLRLLTKVGPMIIQTEARPRTVPDRYRAPSLSWASTDEEITAGEPHEMGIILDVSSMFYIKVAFSNSIPVYGPELPCFGMSDIGLGSWKAHCRYMHRPQRPVHKKRKVAQYLVPHHYDLRCHWLVNTPRPSLCGNGKV